MTHPSPARPSDASLPPAQEAAVRRWGAVAVLLLLVCLGLARLGGAAARPAKTPKTGGAPPPKESSQTHTYGRVRTVLTAVNLVVVTPEGTHINVRLLGVEPPVVPHPASDGSKPLPGQPFGVEAETYVRDLLRGKQVQMDSYGKDRRGRTLAVVWLGDINVNRTLVQEGLAWVSPSIPVPKVRAELEVVGRQAQVGKYGLWALPNPDPPWEFRKRYNLSAE